MGDVRLRRPSPAVQVSRKRMTMEASRTNWFLMGDARLRRAATACGVAFLLQLDRADNYRLLAAVLDSPSPSPTRSSPHGTPQSPYLSICSRLNLTFQSWGTYMHRWIPSISGTSNDYPSGYHRKELTRPPVAVHVQRSSPPRDPILSAGHSLGKSGHMQRPSGRPHFTFSSVSCPFHLISGPKLVSF